jgi:hypothetical protein
LLLGSINQFLRSRRGPLDPRGHLCRYNPHNRAHSHQRASASQDTTLVWSLERGCSQRAARSFADPAPKLFRSRPLPLSRSHTARQSFSPSHLPCFSSLAHIQTHTLALQLPPPTLSRTLAFGPKTAFSLIVFCFCRSLCQSIKQEKFKLSGDLQHYFMPVLDRPKKRIDQ